MLCRKVVTVLSRLSLVLLVVCCVGARAWAGQLSGGVEGITKPKQDIYISFITSGRVARVNVYEGMEVRQGETLAELDCSAENVRLEQLRKDAEDETNVAAADAELKQKVQDLARMLKAHHEGAASDSELEYAKLAIKIGELKLLLSQQEKERKRMQYQELKVELARRKLVSPIDGVVEIIEIEKGESIEGLHPVIRVIALDSLWVDLTVPLKMLPKLKKSKDVKIAFPPAGRGIPEQVIDARVINISTIADAASETLKVRIEAKNPRYWPLGTRVQVFLPGQKMYRQTPEDLLMQETVGEDKSLQAGQVDEGSNGNLDGVGGKPKPQNEASLDDSSKITD